MNREREQNRLEEGIGDGRQARQREQNRLDENTETGAPADAPAPWNLDGAQLRFRYGNHAGREGR